MKLSELERYTVVGSSEYKLPLINFIQRIDEFVEEDGLQLCPDFQRGHVWTEKQQIAFVEHVLKGGVTGTTIYINHPNWQGSFEQDIDNPCVLVDGLQRITAIRRFINGEIKVFGRYVDEWEDKDKVLKRSHRIVMGINVNNLKTRKEVLKWYLEMNSGGTPHSDEEIQRVAKLYEDEK